MLVSTTFRPRQAIALANNTRYGLAASVWSENINVALDAAAAIKAGVAVDQFDQSVRRRRWLPGGYRESGLVAKGGREGFMNT